MSWPEAKYIIDNVHAGIAPNNMASFSCTIGDGSVKVKFTDPADTIVENQVLASWKGTKILIKEGMDPIVDENDGTVLLDNQVRGAYTDDAYEITDLVNDTPYTIAAFPYSDQGVYNRSMENQRTVIPKAYILLGFRVSKTDSNPATRITYTEQAEGLTPAKVDLTTGVFDYGDFGNFWFVTENKPYMVRNDGSIAYQLDPNDYTKKVDGTESDVSDVNYSGNAMAMFPLVWMKQWQDDLFEYCNICNMQLDDTYKAYAHTREDGSIMDYIWISCFEGALDSSKVRSIKGLTPMNSQTGTDEITFAKNNGKLWNTRTWSQHNLIRMLLLLIGRSDDVQTTFGFGYYTGGTSSAPNYLPLGDKSDKGQFYGTNQTRDTVKVFHVENLWGDVWERIAGMTYNQGVLKTKMVPPYNTTGEGYENTGITIGGSSGGYINISKMSDQGRLPIQVSGSSSTYQCDGCYFSSSGDYYAMVGGYSDDGLACGLALRLYSTVSISYWSCGSALSCEQPAA